MDSERIETGRRTRGVGGSSELEAARFLNADGGVDNGGRRGRDTVGTSGKVVDGAGFGEGMFRSDSLDVRRRAGTTGVGDMIIGFSVRLRGCETWCCEMTYNTYAKSWVDFASAVQVQLVDLERRENLRLRDGASCLLSARSR